MKKILTMFLSLLMVATLGVVNVSAEYETGSEIGTLEGNTQFTLNYISSAITYDGNEHGIFNILCLDESGAYISACPMDYVIQKSENGQNNWESTDGGTASGTTYYKKLTGYYRFCWKDADGNTTQVGPIVQIKNNVEVTIGIPTPSYTKDNNPYYTVSEEDVTLSFTKSGKSGETDVTTKWNDISVSSVTEDVNYLSGISFNDGKLTINSSSLVAGIYKVTLSASTDDNTTSTTKDVYIKKEAYVAQIGETKYETLEEAITNAPDGSTIKLLANYTIKNNLTIGKNITIDLNGNTLTVNGSIYINGKTLTIKDDTGEGSVVLNKADSHITANPTANAHIIAAAGGTFILESGTIVNECKNGDKGGNGVAIAAQGGTYESSPVYSTVIIRGGNYSGRESFIGRFGYGASAVIEAGAGYLLTDKDEFRFYNPTEASSITVQGGTFYHDLSDYLTSEYNTVKQKLNGSSYDVYVVEKINTNTNTNSDTATTTTPTKTYDPKDKNKDGVVSCEEEMNSANWVWSTTKGACVYSVTNTSAK